MKRVLRMLLIGSVLVVAVGLLAVVTYDKYLAILLWPGFLLVNYVCSLFGFDGIAFTHFGLIFWPALLINVVLYGLMYLLFREAAALRRRRGWARPKGLGY